MAEFQRELVITRVAFLELKDEQRLVKEGYDLLDEKRILLATEIRRQLGRLRALRGKSRSLEAQALSALRAALGMHGLDELALYPPLSTADDRLGIRRTRLLGLELVEAQFEGTEPRGGEPPVNPTLEARSCAQVYRRWLALMAELAACQLNLRRLAREYIRTERRARALEHVLMPEIESALKIIDEQLEGQDQEEVARLRGHRAA